MTRFLYYVKRTSVLLAVLAVSILAGVYMLQSGGAATASVGLEPEQGTVKQPALIAGDTAASGGSVVRFVAPKMVYGVSVDAGNLTGGLDAFQTAAGKRPGLIMDYAGFPYDADYPAWKVALAADRGAQFMLTWEPYDYMSGPNQPAYALASIIRGDHDVYIKRWAQQIKQDGRPVYLRFAHEMNGNWYPWSEQTNGNKAGEYVLAWKYVHGLFTSAGVSNVQWVWSPNVSYPGSTPYSQLYPGEAYVDMIAFDGYNGGSTLNMGGWQSIDQIMIPSFKEARAISKRPFLIGETASSEFGGSKSAWIDDMFTKLPQYRDQYDVQGFIWFNHNKETDWRIQSSAAAQEAFRKGISSDLY